MKRWAGKHMGTLWASNVSAHWSCLEQFKLLAGGFGQGSAGENSGLSSTPVCGDIRKCVPKHLLKSNAWSVTAWFLFLNILLKRTTFSKSCGVITSSPKHVFYGKYTPLFLQLFPTWCTYRPVSMLGSTLNHAGWIRFLKCNHSWRFQRWVI